MRGKNRKTIASYLKLPQFTTMNVIDGQASLVITYSSLIFYSLTIDNILNIIVLLILAGVSIATLTGDNGLLTKSNEAVVENEKGEERDQIALAYQAVKLDELADSDNDDDITVDNLKTALENNGIKQATVTAEADGALIVEMPSGNKYKVTQAGVITDIQTGNMIPQPPVLPITVSEAKEKATVFPENKKLTDDCGNSVTIPEGFKIASDSATDVAGGIVIEDATYEGTLGSQFVWIPVGTVTGKVNGIEKTATIELGRYDFTQNSDGTVTTSTYTGDYLEENAKDIQNLKNYGNAIAEDIEAFKASTRVDKNGGYYIGRYEARKNEEGNLTVVEIDEVYNIQVQSDAARLSRDMYNENLNFTSDLTNSYAWDTAIVFEQMFDNREYKTKPYSLQNSLNTNFLTTGTKELSDKERQDKICNIWDMSSNYLEWSTETGGSGIPVVVRGGGYADSTYYTSLRMIWGLNASNVSFRPILYF